MESILKQDYPSIEMIVINDGSTDGTESLVNSFVERFKSRGYALRIIHQENAGQSSAINNGLKYVTGEFLVWPDSDDYFATSNAISMMVKAFENSNKNIGLVRVHEALIKRTNENDEIIGIYGQGLSGFEYSKKIFKECLLQENGFYYTPGGFMIKTEYLFNSTKSIFTDKLTGQNAQLLFPILYHYDCYTIPEIYYHVLVRPDSHSRSIAGNFNKCIQLFDAYEETNRQTIENIINISQDDLVYYESLNKSNYDLKRLAVSCQFNKLKNAKIYYRRLKESKFKIPSSILIRYIFLQLGILQLVRYVNKFKNKI